MLDKQMRETLVETLINGINESLDSETPLDKQYIPTILAAFIMPMVLIDTIDRYIEHRIESDKVIVGVLKDIQNSVDTLSQTMECINNVGLVIHSDTEEKEN